MSIAWAALHDYYAAKFKYIRLTPNSLVRDYMLILTHLKLIVISLALVVLSGCAGKVINPIPMDQNLLSSNSDKRIGIVLSNIPATDISYPGADCLLCLGVASAMNSTLSGYVETLDNADMYTIKQELADIIQASGNAAIFIDQPLDLETLPDFESEQLNAAEKDFRGLANANNLTHLLVVNVDYLGFLRNYASYVPTSAPFAVFNGKAYVIDLATNNYQWYLPVKINQLADGEWDEPETFPGLTNAFYQTIGKAKHEIVQPFKTLAQ